jgi:hypothetical protein
MVIRRRFHSLARVRTSLGFSQRESPKNKKAPEVV